MQRDFRAEKLKTLIDFSLNNSLRNKSPCDILSQTAAIFVNDSLDSPPGHLVTRGPSSTFDKLTIVSRKSLHLRKCLRESALRYWNLPFRPMRLIKPEAVKLPIMRRMAFVLIYF